MTANLTETVNPWMGEAYEEQVTAPSGIPRNGADSKGSDRPFEYWYHPLRVGYSDERGGWHYKLRMVTRRPGVEGVMSRGDGFETYAQKLTGMGWKAITPGDRRLGKFANYVRVYKVQGGGRRYLPMWVTPHPLGGKVRWRDDPAQYAEFLQAIMASGVADAVDDLVKEDAIERQRQRVIRCEMDLMRAPGSGLILSRAEDATRTLAKMRGDDEGFALEVLQKRAEQAASAHVEAAMAAQDTVEKRGKP